MVSQSNRTELNATWGDRQTWDRLETHSCWCTRLVINHTKTTQIIVIESLSQKGHNKYQYSHCFYVVFAYLIVLHSFWYQGCVGVYNLQYEEIESHAYTCHPLSWFYLVVKPALLRILALPALTQTTQFPACYCRGYGILFFLCCPCDCSFISAIQHLKQVQQFCRQA